MKNKLLYIAIGLYCTMPNSYSCFAIFGTAYSFIYATSVSNLPHKLQKIVKIVTVLQ